MTPNPFLLLFLTTGGGFGLIGGVLLIRSGAQRARDSRRVVVALRFPRGLKDEQVLAVVRAVIGLAPAKNGLGGRDSVVMEVIGRRSGITHRLHLPATSRAYLVAQLRAAVPGLAVEEIVDFVPERCRTARELRRRITTADLAVTDVAATSRTILAACTALSRSEVVVWQLVIGGGVAARPPATLPIAVRLLHGVTKPAPVTPRKDSGVVGVALRLGALAANDRRAEELVARLRRAAASVSAPQARLVPRLVPRLLVVERIARAATPLTAAPVLLRPEEVVALLGWPVATPLVPGVNLGGSPQLPAANTVPRTGRVLGRATAEDRAVAQPVKGAAEHSLIVGPTGSGKSWLAARLMLGDIEAGRGALLIDPKGGTAKAVIERLPEEAIGRTIIIDPTDEERPVPLPLLAAEAGGIPELAADTLIGLLRYRYADLGPRSTDILASSLYALARVPNATLMDVLPLWGDASFRATVAGLVRDDMVLSSFFAWFDGLSSSERSYMLAAPMNKIRPLLQRAVVRNVLAAPRSTFTIAEALQQRLVVIVMLPEGVLGSDATSLLGQVVLARLWAAVQARSGRSLYTVTIDEAPRFLDTGTDLGDVLARSREYGVGACIIGQSLAQFPTSLRDIALNSARTKVAFGTSASDARKLADEFGPGVEADFFTGLARYEAIGAVSLGGTVSPPFTFATEALAPRIPGRANAVRAASRARYGIPKAEIEASHKRDANTGDDGLGGVGRRTK